MGINKVQYGNTVLIDLTDTTAEASDVLAGKYFYGKDGVKTLGSGSPTIQSLTVVPSTSSQTFNSGSVDGYKPVTVSAVSQTNLSEGNIKSGTTVTINNGTGNLWSVTGTYTGGIVQGTFTTGSSAGVSSVNIPYTGSGYPISCIVFVDGGSYNSAISGWYNSVQRYAVGMWAMTKAVTTSTPSYGESGSENHGVVLSLYKNSTSNPSSYSRTSSVGLVCYSTTDAGNTATNCIRLKSSKLLSYYVNTSSYGLLPNTTYRYIITYSS